jgi:hypothetical protein
MAGVGSKLWIDVDAVAAEPRCEDLGFYRVDFRRSTRALCRPCWLEVDSVVGVLISCFPLV